MQIQLFHTETRARYLQTDSDNEQCWRFLITVCKISPKENLSDVGEGFLLPFFTNGGRCLEHSKNFCCACVRSLILDALHTHEKFEISN